MYFESFAAALAMDGHGAYVWPAYLVALIVVALMVVLPLRRRRRQLRDFADNLRREQAAGREEIS